MGSEGGGSQIRTLNDEIVCDASIYGFRLASNTLTLLNSTSIDIVSIETLFLCFAHFLRPSRHCSYTNFLLMKRNDVFEELSL